ncbi:MAG: NAD(P)-dependent oxidoreductase [Marinifilaceae bacterium]
MRVVIFGATGIAGKAILKQALKQGFDVVALTRDKRKITITDPHLTVVEGEVTNPVTVSEIVTGADAVIQSLGIGGKGNGKPTTFVSQTNRMIMMQMEQVGIKRFVVLSALGAGNSIAFLPRIFTSFILPHFMKWYKVILDDKNRLEADVMNSNLDWVIVRSAGLNEKSAKGTITATLDGKGIRTTITAEEMAHFVIRQITDNTYLKQAPTISN